jgi:hypothetical protein
VSDRHARCPQCRAAWNLRTKGQEASPDWNPLPLLTCPRCERSPDGPGDQPQVSDTIPAPEVHPIQADILECWENGLPYFDTEQEARAFREAMAYLLRRESRR